ncbi:hypothetical protein HMPREF0063_12283 [Aeromicrobium marinum DSM 15272]|uniref:Uncharacterized protein n=1 Tax=Aeromicrobium marinum DSM 15272 TaxID=585531 RepID=E2SCX1_9ACTN|nr:hypothetical protein [Aeromicrobium marinum]EFQ83074.1 hypothetical protein HMPREF0063_12283 [Aeromicrobium marinum DSM 15272]
MKNYDRLVNPASTLGFLMTFLDVQRTRVRDERGASAVEWVLIAAALVLIVGAVVAVLRDAIEGRAEDVGNQIR